jgi:hypothetical protein
MLTVDPFITPGDVGMPGAADVVGGRLKATLVVGAAPNTNIAVAGIKPEDKIWKVIEFATAAAIATMADRTVNVSVIADGQIQIDTDTAADQLLVLWLDVNP